MKKNIIIYLCFFIALIIVAVLIPVENDEIWGYGFSYNIASGLVPYKDFNMIVGPLHSILFSLPMKLFGNHLYLFEIEHCLFYAFIFTLVYKKLKTNTIYIFMALCLGITLFGYNMFTAMLMLLILVLKESNIKYKEALISIIIGIVLCTKHNIGLLLLIAQIYYNRKQLLNIIPILIPISICGLYLIANNALYDYIEYCYSGAGNYLHNINTDFVFTPVYIYLFYQLMKYRKNNKNIVYYVLAAQIMVFPILNLPHIICAILPVLYLLFKDNTLSKKTTFYIKYFFIIGFIVTIFIMPLYKCFYIKNNSFINGKRMDKEMNDVYKYEYKYYINNKNKYDKVYLFINYAYLVKLADNQNPSYYDLINRGNLGKNENKFITNIGKECKNIKCLFILDNMWFKRMNFSDQLNDKFRTYVMKNYNYLETLDNGDKIYTN